MSYNGWNYSVQRIDLLIIAISGAGIYVILEALKFSKANPLNDIWLLKISGIVLVLAVIINLISQFSGRECNALSMRIAMNEMDAIEDKSQTLRDKITKLECHCEIYSSITTVLNNLSLILMISGLGGLMVFFTVTF